MNLIVIFHDLPKLLDYTRDFTDYTDYTITHESDAPEILIYRNDKKGVELSVQTGRGLYISCIFLYPSQENTRRMKSVPRNQLVAADFPARGPATFLYRAAE